MQLSNKEFVFTVTCKKLSSKPRMTQRDRWAGRDIVERWFAFRELVVLSYRQSGGKCFFGPVSIGYEFHIREGRRVDLDNLIKGINDALNGEAWPDDCCSIVREYEFAKVIFVKAGTQEKASISIRGL